MLLCHSVTSELPLPSLAPLPRRVLRDASAGAAKRDRIFLKCCSYPNIPLCKMFLNKTTCLFDGQSRGPFPGSVDAWGAVGCFPSPPWNREEQCRAEQILPAREFCSEALQNTAKIARIWLEF